MTFTEQKSESPRILIADDDPVFLALAAASLKAAGFNTVSVMDGAQAMHTLHRQTFDAAIIDLLMPRIDGLRLIGLIRATPTLRQLPILVITSQRDPRVKDEGLLVGANDCLTKPVDWTQLPSHLSQLIEKQQV